MRYLAAGKLLAAFALASHPQKDLETFTRSMYPQYLRDASQLLGVQVLIPTE
jgi:hypothetical protein